MAALMNSVSLIRVTIIASTAPSRMAHSSERTFSMKGARVRTGRTAGCGSNTGGVSAGGMGASTGASLTEAGASGGAPPSGGADAAAGATVVTGGAAIVDDSGPIGAGAAGDPTGAGAAGARAGMPQAASPSHIEIDSRRRENTS